MTRNSIVLICCLIGCNWAALGCDGTEKQSEAQNNGDDTASDVPIVIDSDVVPEAICDPTPLQDVTIPTSVVGNGTPESCTELALQAAADTGGTIVFDCGDAMATIEIGTTIVFENETILDGGGRVTLSGGGTSRILYLDSGYDQTLPRLTVQRLSFVDGQSPQGGDDTAMGGGAIYRDGGSLTVVDCVFENNHAPTPGQDIAGGAIYGFGGGETIISGSSFVGNEASNGGAVGSLNGDLTIINSVFQGNRASGTEGNPGNGGCGGAIYMDGTGEATLLCGVNISNNQAGAIGGGVFRVSNDDSGVLSMERTTIDSNTVTAVDSGNAGGLYLQGLQMTVSNSTVSRNRAFYNGGLWIHTCNVDIWNVTIAENVAVGSNGGGLWLSGPPTGRLLNCTIANNHSIADDQVAGAIFGSGLELKNTVVSGNTAMWVPGCNENHDDDGGNLQWPDGALCTSSPLVADPFLGELLDNGGETETMLPSEQSVLRGLGSDCPPTDQIGTQRSDPCTAGAVE